MVHEVSCRGRRGAFTRGFCDLEVHRMCFPRVRERLEDRGGLLVRDPMHLGPLVELALGHGIESALKARRDPTTNSSSDR